MIDLAELKRRDPNIGQWPASAVRPPPQNPRTVCAVCATDRNLKRARKWCAIGICFICKGYHVLFSLECGSASGGG